jgi:hypothetical protein
MPSGKKRTANHDHCPAQFYTLLVKAGLAKKRSKKNTGRGHSVKRTVSELTFHSLRHNTTSWLKRAGPDGFRPKTNKSDHSRRPFL